MKEQDRNAPLEYCGIIRPDKQPVLIQILLEGIRPEHLQDAEQLIVIISSSEEVLAPENLHADDKSVSISRDAMR